MGHNKDMLITPNKCLFQMVARQLGDISITKEY